MVKNNLGAGTAAYPATLLTHAPLAVLLQAMSAVSSTATAPQPSPMQQLPRSMLLLHDITYSTLGRVRCVDCMSIGIAAGRSVLIEGPSGSGKSTLLRILGGLHPLDSGYTQLPPLDQVRLVSPPHSQAVMPFGFFCCQIETYHESLCDGGTPVGVSDSMQLGGARTQVEACRLSLR